MRLILRPRLEHIRCPPMTADAPAMSHREGENETHPDARARDQGHLPNPESRRKVKNLKALIELTASMGHARSNHDRSTSIRDTATPSTPQSTRSSLPLKPACNGQDKSASSHAAGQSVQKSIRGLPISSLFDLERLVVGRIYAG